MISTSFDPMKSRVVDLGESNAPWLVFGGPYGNLQATRAVRSEAARRGIPASRVICTGDVVAYCANPAETVAEIRDWGCAVLAGNCERQIAEGAEDCGCGFEDGTVCDRLSASWYSHARAALDDSARGWMAQLPDFLTFAQNGRDCFVLHGGIRDISRFLWPVSPDVDFQEELDRIASLRGHAFASGMVFAGHSGLPFFRKIGMTDWVNAGVIGMPPHDGGRATRYAVIEDGKVSILSLNYDWRAAREAMTAVGLTQGYHEALETGLWPSQDILPPGLRRLSQPTERIA